MTDPLPRITEAMATAARKIRPVGKDLRNQEAGYAARSIDGILDAVHDALADAGVVVIPEVLDRDVTERRAQSGRPLYHVALRVAYAFHAPDGSSLTAVVWGEAMDSQDKATPKAMSAAMKAALIQTFTIPVTGDDPDAHEPNPAASEPEADPGDVEAVVDRLETLWRVVGRKAYPKGWREAGLPAVPWIREHGLLVSQVIAAGLILDAAEARIADETPPEGPRIDPETGEVVRDESTGSTAPSGLEGEPS